MEHKVALAAAEQAKKTLGRHALSAEKEVYSNAMWQDECDEVHDEEDLEEAWGVLQQKMAEAKKAVREAVLASAAYASAAYRIDHGETWS